MPKLGQYRNACKDGSTGDSRAKEEESYSQRVWMSCVMGYSSWSIKFLEMFSSMSLSAMGGIHVCTKEAKFNSGEPSRESSSWII